MALLDRKAAHEIASRVLEWSSADETEVTVDSEVDDFVRFADVGPTQNGARVRITVSIRARLRAPGGGPGFREARVVTGALDDEGLRAAVERARIFAEHSPVDADLPELGGPVTVGESPPARPTLDHGFREKAAWVARAIEACEATGLAPAGLVQTTGCTRLIANSRERVAQGARTRASFALTATGANGSGFADAIGPDVDRLDARGVISRAVERACAAQNPVPLDPGEYTVVLEPPAVSALLLFSSYCGFGAREVAEQSSFLCGRVGEQLFPADFTLRDDAFDPHNPGLPFDAEGTPRRVVALIESGILRGPVTDRAWAARTGVECTGHALAQPSEEGPRPRNLVLESGRESLEDLIGGVDRGLLVSQLHYANMIDPKDLSLTGTTRHGTFLIEGGRLGPPVRELRFTDSLVRVLGNCTGIGSERAVAGALFDGEVLAPALRIEGFRFTSSAEAG